jgi:ubiquinone/menaquinone biosynthesis C-methylase UbiE
MEKNEKENLINYEMSFHDQWADSVSPEEVLVDEIFSVPSCVENLFILSKLGDLHGKKLLELGTGLGEGATFFSKCGAQVVSTDVSPGMLKLAQRVGNYHNTCFNCAISDAGYLGFKSNTFDFVYAANTLHHVEVNSCLNEVFRVLKPGGKAAFWDPIKYNPIINIYRSMANQVRTEDEHPLGLSDINFMKEKFLKLELEFSGLATLGVFLKFYFVDMVHPNEERYWKKIIVDYSSFANLYKFLRNIDKFVLRIPGIQWLAWNVAVVITK